MKKQITTQSIYHKKICIRRHITPHDFTQCVCVPTLHPYIGDRCILCVQFERNISPDVIYVLVIAKMKVKWPIGLIRTVFEKQLNNSNDYSNIAVVIE